MPDPRELDDLMKLLADGERSAFRPVFDLLWGPILRLCTSLVKNEADGADAAQQAMTKILGRASDYDARRPALPWAMAIAGWECRTILRRRGRRREVPEEQASEGALDEPEVNLAAKELAQSAVAALGELSPADQEVLRATFWEEAPVAGVKGAALRKRRERALDWLRQAARRLYGLE